MRSEKSWCEKGLRWVGNHFEKKREREGDRESERDRAREREREKRGREKQMVPH